MKAQDPISDAFREKLSQLEADPGPGAWEAIQAKIGAQAAAGGSSAVAASASTWKTLLIAATAATGIGAGIYWYVAAPEPAKTETPALTQTLEPTQANTPETQVTEKAEAEIQPNTPTPAPQPPVASASTVNTRPQQDPNSDVPEGAMGTGWGKNGRSLAAYEANGTSSTPAGSTDQPSSVEDVPAGTSGSSRQALTAPVQPSTATPVAEESALSVRILASETEGPVPFRVTFSPQSAATRYEWSFGDGNNSAEASPSHEFTQAGTYTVTLTAYDEQGRKTTEQLRIEAKAVSSIVAVNVFSPNNDGVNDYFMLDESRTTLIGEFFIQVFDPSGKLLFESNDLAFRWDGRDREGRLVPAGVYRFSYQARGKDGKPHARVDYLTITY